MPDDWRAVLAYQQDARYLEYYPWSARTESDAQEFVQWFLGEQAESPRRRMQLSVILPEADLLIGNCGIRHKPDSDWEADIGHEIAPDYWRRGYATKAAASLVKHGFTSMGLHRISSWCIAENVASVSVLRKLRMREKVDCRRTSSSKGVGGTP